MTKTKVIALLMNKKGELNNAYSPLQNLIHANNDTIGDFTTKEFHFDKNNPVDIIVTDEYDGSTNLIINDDKNNPKLINSRFSVQENHTFEVPIHMGNKVTNIYEENTFQTDTLLLKLYNHIPTLEFQGIHSGGSFKCGSYVFYFKLSDSDGNMTNIVQESGIIQVHMGTPNSPKIRMGMQDENAKKCIKFKLSGIDAGFDYVKVFYERSSTDDSLTLTHSYFMINHNFSIEKENCDILLTGSEDTILIDKFDIQSEFADISTAKTQTVVDNILFMGNISAYELDYKELLKIAWKIIPTVVLSESIGSIGSQKYQLFGKGAYYNIENVYNKTGYWGDEFYRFGIVFIYDNNLLSPVFNIQGANLENDINPNDYFNKFNEPWESEPDDFFFNKSLGLNSKGVIKLPKQNIIKAKSGIISPTPIGIKFDFSYIGSDNPFPSDPEETLRKHNIKGFFMVRLKRIPTIIAQGMVVGLTGRYNGCIPVLLDKNKNYITKSFLSPGRSLLSEGSTVTITSDISNKALLVPDYEINTATLNLIFTGEKFYIEKAYSTDYKIVKDHHFVSNIEEDDSQSAYDVKLTAVQKETKIITDGENYFSTRAGNPDEPYKTEDVNNRWNKTAPQDLTISTSLIRGNWGSYVGMSCDKFNYGDIVTIKQNEWKDKDYIYLEYEKRFKDYSLYSAISPRINISDFNEEKSITCYRGDCFINLFTHRMMSNFIDPELPTNTKIIDPSCWALNYGVRCTAEILGSTHSNLTSDSDGWYIPSPLNTKSSVVSLIFGILTGNIGTIINAAKSLSNNPQVDQKEYANEIVLAFEVYIGKDKKNKSENDYEDPISDDMEQAAAAENYESIIKKRWIKKVNPKEQELQGGFSLKAIFKSDDKWELHGLASINRADVNAVSFGEWITFPICSLYNLALRDIDFNQATEESSHKKKRSFYPLDAMDPYNHLLESESINGAAKVSIGTNLKPAFRTVPFLKQEYFNRIYWSKPNVALQFINSYRIIFDNQFKEYNKEFGSITKLISLENQLLVVFQHGMGLLPINKNPQNEKEYSLWLASRSVLPNLINTLTSNYGSMWKDSILKTPSGNVYGMDTVAKKIWKFSSKGLEFISDHRVSKFLNEHINLSEYDFNEYQGHINVKTHYNEFKHDVMFTYYKDEWDGEKWIPGKQWSLCYNEITNNFITFYDWTPVESCNIDNIFFSFDKELIDSVLDNSLKLKLISLPFNGYHKNKHSIDKAFTCDCFVHIIPETTEIPIAITSGNKYLSFYCDSNVIIKRVNKLIDSIPMDNGWTFYIYEVNPESIVLITFEENGHVTELKLSSSLNDEESLNKNNSTFKYLNLRNSEGSRMYLWKHGQSGIYDCQEKIKPTNWYGKQHEWNFEFIVNEQPSILKIFNNLTIISNKAAPYKFEYEVVGEGYDWVKYKEIINLINQQPGDLKNNYLIYLKLNPNIKKLPFLKTELTDRNWMYYHTPDYWENETGQYSLNHSETVLIEDEQLNEFKVHTESLGNDMKKFGRIRGNMEYLEDLWKVEIRPINFRWAYLDKDELKFTKTVETRHRDKFIRIKVRYDGKDLAVIQAINTLFDYSFA